MPKVHYIIPTGAIGGSEKRFIELYCYLQQNYARFDFQLIISKQLFEVIRQDDNIYRLLRTFEHTIVLYDFNPGEPVISFQKKLYSFVRAHSKTEDIFHFMLMFPVFVFPLPIKRTIYTLAESSLDNVNFKGKFSYFFSILRAKEVDILDPVIYKKMMRLFCLKKERLHLTPGSFVDTDVFKPAGSEKKNWFVFLGRFHHIKQVIPLLNAVPEIYQNLQMSGRLPGDCKFIFLGYGSLADEMNLILRSPAFKDLPVEIKMTNSPEELLSRSKIFFSLQLRNNYPSKSLLEAVSAGNIPLVTDVGTTRVIADPAFSYYVPENFTAADIAEQMIAILSLDEHSLQQKMLGGRNFISKNFSIETSAKYYIDLYNRLC